MCTQPKYGLNPNDPHMASPCRECLQCKLNRVNDLVGRCIAEAETSDQAFSVTLTYAGDTPNSVILCYQDVQNFLKRFRKAGYNPRYIVAGEYGEVKKRAHWHIVIFMKGKTLEVVSEAERENDWQVVLEKRIDFAPWTNRDQGRGFVFFQRPDYKGFEYALKYALKNENDRSAVTKSGRSKKPLLGYEFFMALADDYVEKRLPVHSPAYAFMDILDSRGKHRQFWLQGRAREKFLDRYRTMWRLRYKEPEPHTEWFDEAYSQKVEEALPFSKEQIDQMIMRRRLAAQEKAKIHSKRIERAWAEIPDRPEWLPEWPTHHSFVKDGVTWHLNCFIDGLLISRDQDGDEPWRVIRTTDRALLARQLLEVGAKQSALPRLIDWLLYAWPWLDKQSLKSPHHSGMPHKLFPSTQSNTPPAW